MRLFARAPLNSGGRRLLAQEEGEQEEAPSQGLLGVPDRTGNATLPPPSNATASDAEAEAGALPLPRAFLEGRRQAEALGLGSDEHQSEDGVVAAVADGTLDAYL